MRIGLLLRLWRRQNRLTQKAAAGRIGLTGGTLARLEKGEAMHGATLATVLVWLMGREEPSNNEAFCFEEKDAAAGEDQVAERNATPAGELERIPYKLSGEEAGQVDAVELSGNSGEFAIKYPDETQNYGFFYAEQAGAAIAEESEEAAQHPLHAVDQNSTVCGVQPE